MKRLWILSATMSKSMVAATGMTTNTKTVFGYRVAYNEDEARGSFVKKMMEDHNQYGMSDLAIMEIPFETIFLVVKDMSPALVQDYMK